MSEARETPDRPAPSVRALIRRRSDFLLLLFVLWAAIVSVRLGAVMVVQRDHYLAAMAKESWREGVIPPLRGRLLDRDGRPLAWSTRHFALRWRVPKDKGRVVQQWQRLRAVLGSLAPWTLKSVLGRRGQVVEVKKDLLAIEVDSVLALGEGVPGLRLDAYFVRHRRRALQVRGLLGDVTSVDGIETGLSGLEQAHDGLLRGQPGTYRVMLDKAGAWIESTWQRTCDIQPGYDVYLPFAVGD